VSGVQAGRQPRGVRAACTGQRPDVDEHRRLWRRFERPAAELPEHAGAEANGTDPELARALRDLPARMRAAAVFRFFYDLDVAGLPMSVLQPAG
jgi:hypothetical protein